MLVNQLFHWLLPVMRELMVRLRSSAGLGLEEDESAPDGGAEEMEATLERLDESSSPLEPRLDESSSPLEPVERLEESGAMPEPDRMLERLEDPVLEPDKTLERLEESDPTLERLDESTEDVELSRLLERFEQSTEEVELSKLDVELFKLSDRLEQLSDEVELSKLLDRLELSNEEVLRLSLNEPELFDSLPRDWTLSDKLGERLDSSWPNEPSLLLASPLFPRVCSKLSIKS